MRRVLRSGGRRAEQDGDLGQLLNPGSLDEGWDARTLVGWHPDGDRLLFWEDRGDPFDARHPCPGQSCRPLDAFVLLGVAVHRFRLVGDLSRRRHTRPHDLP